MFEPVNSQYVKALSTYGMGFQVVCFGNWIANKVEADFSTPVKRIPFTLDHSIYNYEALPKTVDILLFARPSQPRRCFELAVEALRIVYKQNRSVRIGLYGEESYGDLGFKYHNFGLIKNQSTLADLYRNSRVGICFSPTNPSLVGYEMIACGLPVIDIKVPGWEVNFGGEDIVYYAQPVPEEISERIMDALGGDSEYQERVARGVQYSKAMPSDDAIGHSMLKFVTE
jgi:glycosyltransferase involved in cell wall biosynthesis